MAKWKNPPWHPMAGLRVCFDDRQEPTPALPPECPECGCCLCDNRQCGGDGFCSYCGWEPESTATPEQRQAGE